jgi:hypothetical protein
LVSVSRSSGWQRREPTHRTDLVSLDGIDDLRAGIHDERPVGEHRFVDGKLAKARG